MKQQQTNELKRRSDGLSFARVDESKLRGEETIMTAEEALALVKGTKRSKETTDLRDQL